MIARLNKSLLLFRKMLEQDEHFSIELTGPDSSDQNIHAEHHHQDSMYAPHVLAELGPEY